MGAWLMALLITSGTLLQCTFGLAPGTLNVLPVHCTMSGAPAATIMDHLPMVNIMPFGMCNCLGNPTVASLTAASLGVLTPAPCIPMTASPWVPGSPTVLIGKLPALQNSSKTLCNWGGVIQVVAPAQVTTSVP